MPFDPTIKPPKYSIGDILKITLGDICSYILIEDVKHNLYCWRNLEKGHTGSETVGYIDQHESITKVA